MADLTTVCDNAIEEIPEFSTMVSKFENGVEQRRARRSGSIRKFNLVYRNRTQAEFQTVRDLFLEKKGALTTFSWTNPNDGVSYTVRFLEDSLMFERVAYQRYNFSFTVIQVL